MKKLGLQLEYKETGQLREYDPNDQENTTYVYLHLHYKLRATKLKKHKSRFYVDDVLHVFADTVPMLTLKELQDRYHVSFTYYYGNKKQYTTARGRIKGFLTGVEPPNKRREKVDLTDLMASELTPWERSFKSYDHREFAMMYWDEIDTSLNPKAKSNLPYTWVDMNKLNFRPKKGTFTQTHNI